MREAGLREHDGISLGRGRQTMSPHHRGNRGSIGRPRCAVHDGSHFPEKMRAEYARSRNREHLRDDRTEIVEAVDHSPRNAKHVTCAAAMRYSPLLRVVKPRPLWGQSCRFVRNRSGV